MVLSVSAVGCVNNLPSVGADGWHSLIDGARGLANFEHIGVANWSELDGAIQVSAGGKAPAYLVSRNTYRDFVIRAEFWSSNDANSGIFIRCKDPSDITEKTCYEINIFDQRRDPSYGTAAIVDVAKVMPMPKAGGKWNTFEITATGPRLVVVFNGTQTVDVEDKSLTEGRVALQWGRGTVKFRKLQIKPI